MRKCLRYFIKSQSKALCWKSLFEIFWEGISHVCIAGITGQHQRQQIKIKTLNCVLQSIQEFRKINIVTVCNPGIWTII